AAFQADHRAGTDGIARNESDVFNARLPCVPLRKICRNTEHIEQGFLNGYGLFDDRHRASSFQNNGPFSKADLTTKGHCNAKNFRDEVNRVEMIARFEGKGDPPGRPYESVVARGLCDI